MKDYRLYFLDRISGHVAEVEEFAASDDAEAIVRAAARSDPRPRELWHDHHKLKHWDETLLETD